MSTTRPSLSDRALRCLGRGERKGAPENPEQVLAEFTAAEVPVFDAVVDAFFHFGGLWFPIGRSRETFRVNTVREGIDAFRCIGDRDESPDLFRISFGEHRTAQCWFVMDGFGRLYADETPIAESLHQWIEHCALQEMVERWDNSVRIVFPDDSVAAIRKWADQNLRRFAPASSRSTAWWLHPQCAVNIFLPWSSERNLSKWVWAFATTPDEAERLAERIRRSTGVKPCSMQPWPP